MERYYDRERQPERALLGEVTLTDGNSVQVSGHTQLRRVKMVGMPGVESLPKEGERVLLIPTDSGEYVILGSLFDGKNLSGGELILRSGSGAYIKLRADGKVELNGLVVSADGKLE